MNMNRKTERGSNTGIGLMGGVFLVFLALKLTNYIDWSWWWVTAPLWAPLVVFLGIAAIVIVFSLLIK